MADPNPFIKIPVTESGDYVTISFVKDNRLVHPNRKQIERLCQYLEMMREDLEPEKVEATE